MPSQSAVVLQGTQVRFGMSQTGVAGVPSQSSFMSQPGTQVFIAPQTVPTMQSVSTVHWTQVRAPEVPVTHIGVPAEQPLSSIVPVALFSHGRQMFAPVEPVSQAGAADVQPRSRPAVVEFWQGWQRAPAVPLPTQIGAVAEQPASVIVPVAVSVQGTQVLVGAPEQTRDEAQVPGKPAATAVCVQAPSEQASVVQAFPSPHSAAVVHATQTNPLALATQFGVALAQPRSVPVATVLMHTSQTGIVPVPVVRQCCAADVQPASRPVRELSVQSTHLLVGAPEQTKPGMHMPGEPDATAVFAQAPAEQLSVVQRLLSSQCAAVVQATHIAAAPVPVQ